MLGIFVWTIDTIIELVLVALSILIGIGLGISFLIGKIGERFLDKRWKDDDED